MTSNNVTNDPHSESTIFNGGFMHVVHMFYLGIQKHLDHVLSTRSELSFSQFLILVGFSCDNQKSTTQTKLAEYLMLSEATVSRHVSILVSKELLSKEKDRYNKKMYNLSLTHSGRKTFERTKKIIIGELDYLFSHIKEKDKESIIKNFNTTLELLQKK